MLFWNNRPKAWSSESMARALYVSSEIAHEIFRSLTQRRLITETEDPRDHFVLNADSLEKQQLLAAVDTIYRRELVRISNMIHSKASRGVRDFANAFRLKKE